MGIRGQLALLVPGAVFIALASVAYVVVHQEHSEQVEDFRVRNERVLQAVSFPVAVLVAQNDVGGLDTLIAQMSEGMRDRDLLELAVVDDQGRVLAHSTAALFNTTISDDFTKGAIASDDLSWARSGSELRLAIPARSGLRWATVTARFSLDRIEAQFERTRLRWVFGAMLVFAFLAGVLSFSMEWLLVRPLRTMQQAVRRMGEGHLGTRVPPLAGRELKELSENVNGMAQALQSERNNLEQTVQERTRELQDLNARLERLAVTDGLTGVYNHRRFQEALHTELLRCERHKRPLGLLMVDVDFFKRVNDTLGHPAGDELLRRLAEVLGRDLRQTDLIARYGGEEFAVLLPETSKAESLHVADRMRQAVESKINEGSPWGQQVTVSIGVATYPEDGAAAEAVLEAADKALYLAKRAGRNRVIAARSAA